VEDTQRVRQGLQAMIRRFWNNERGNYALMTVVAIVPIMGALALAVDYTEMSKQRQEMLNALDASGVATGRRIMEGGTDEQFKAYAKSFFEANLGSVEPANTVLTVLLPQNNTGVGTLKLTAGLVYKPRFFPTFAKLIGKAGPTDVNFSASTEVRLKNTIEVALVLDNSGSMSTIGTGSGKQRIVLLREASKVLVDLLAAQASMMQQIAKPVQFALVPFSASVNIGSSDTNKFNEIKAASWMDQDGISPIHHENFDWTSFTGTNRKVTKIGNIYYKKGTDWGAEDGQKVTRFTLFNEMKYYTNSANTTKANYTSWQGCVEARPYPYDINDAEPTSSNPATLFVPMFAPDETSGADNDWFLYSRNGTDHFWDDVSTNNSALIKQSYMPKYFDIPTIGYVGRYRTVPAGMDVGPNRGCTTTPITPLQDVSVEATKTAIKAAIDAMQPTGNTNVPEGMAWGWRVLSSKEPYTDGRAESEKGNDKVVIVLTDGANTYTSTGSDAAGNKSTYAAYGYAGHWKTPDYTTSRIFQGTSVDNTIYSSSNYTAAMDQQFATLCDNAKTAGLMVITVSLDLRTTNATEKKAIDALTACASTSRFTKDDNGAYKKLYFAATGGTLLEEFKKIAAELSNLRIVG
jgi:Flp pilus assembly protein TadG